MSEGFTVIQRNMLMYRYARTHLCVCVCVCVCLCVCMFVIDSICLMNEDY
jgi:hypothetical protein